MIISSMQNLSDWSRLLLAPTTAFLLSVLFVPLVRRIARRSGYVSLPTQERWRQQPIPYLGGIAFFLGFLVAVLLWGFSFTRSAPFLVISFFALILGLFDDFRRINPATKLVGQIIVAAIAIFWGYSLNFFPGALFDTLLTILWIVGLTNAINLLDNMDGLAGGVGLIAALFLAFFFYQQGDLAGALIAVSLAGALGGFLTFNFYPASIFMGDAGSLFLGSLLSLLAIEAHGQASNILSLVAVPTLILLVHIHDTILVSLTRVVRGQSVTQGGKDHSSHRLVVLGLTEPKAVTLLYGIAVISGVTALLIEQASYTLSLTLLPFVIISFSLFAAYLAQIEIISPEESKKKIREGGFTTLLDSFPYKRRLFEVLLDFFLITFAYYLAFMLKDEFDLDERNWREYLTSLPLVLIGTYSSFFYTGIYRTVWRYTGLYDLVRLAKGAAGAAFLSVLILLLFYRFMGYSRVVFILYPLLLFLGMAGTRLSFLLLDMFVAKPHLKGSPILIYGAGSGGDIVLTECRRNARLHYQPIGFLDDDPRKKGRLIHGIPVVGGIEQLSETIGRKQVEGMIISSMSIVMNGNGEKVRAVCREHGIWVKQLRLEFTQETDSPAP